MEIFSGLNNASVSRLSTAWADISSRARKRHKKIEHVFYPDKNFKVYHHELKRRTLPVIPYFPLVLRDLTFMLLGNPVYTDQGQINFDCWLQALDRLRELDHYLTVSPKQPGEELSTLFMSNLNVVRDEDQLWALSQLAEPSKTVRRSQLVEDRKLIEEMTARSASGAARPPSQRLNAPLILSASAPNQSLQGAAGAAAGHQAVAASGSAAQPAAAAAPATEPMKRNRRDQPLSQVDAAQLALTYMPGKGRLVQAAEAIQRDVASPLSMRRRGSAVAEHNDRLLRTTSGELPPSSLATGSAALSKLDAAMDDLLGMEDDEDEEDTKKSGEEDEDDDDDDDDDD
jgi:hypothetical protein